MEKIVTETTQAGKFINPTRVCLAKDPNYLLIFLADGRIIRNHVNRFKAALKIDFRATAPETVAVAQ